MHKVFLIVLLLLLHGCVITTTNYIRNETESGLVVSIQQERQDLGWDRKEKKSLEIRKNSICNLTTDIFYDTYFYITNTKTGVSTNVNAIRNENYIYAINEIGERQVITIIEADNRTKNLLKDHRDMCIEAQNESE